MRTGHSVVVTLLTLVVSCGAPSTAPPPGGAIISLPTASPSSAAPSESGAPLLGVLDLTRAN